LDVEQSFNRECREVADKSAALAQAVGIHIPPMEELTVSGPLPVSVFSFDDRALLEGAVEANPTVAAAREKVTAATAKLREAQRALSPSLSLLVRRDYLSQDPDSFGVANRHIGPADYRIGLSLEQPVFPLIAESAAIDKAGAELRRARAGYDQARLETDTK